MSNMMSSNAPISLIDLERVIRQVDPRVVLLPQRILRRVIKHDRKITSLGLQVPHRKTYLLDADVASEVLARDELGLDPDIEVSLRGPLILIERPEPKRLARLPRSLALRKYWRFLFHARVDLALDEKRAAGILTQEAVRDRILRIGPSSFDEARAILRYEDYLLPPRDQWVTYREFVAVYLELRHFASRLLPVYFPSLTDLAAVDEVLAEDVDASILYEDTYLPGAAAPEADPSAGLDPDLDVQVSWDDSPRPVVVQKFEPTGKGPTDRQARRLVRQAGFAEKRGNVVRATILRASAARNPSLAENPGGDVDRGVNLLVDRLLPAIGQGPEQAELWRSALAPLIPPASEGLWATEARLLFDLQKVCVDHERPIYTVDLVEWVLSGFRRPIKRLLPVQREVLIAKHLRSAYWRVRHARTADIARTRLDLLLKDAVHHVEENLREQARPRLAEVLDAVGLRPQSVPERVALNKVTEELLDQVVARGYLTMGHLRDAIARNNLKLPDLSGAAEFFRGDQLLQADRRLSVAVDGVYRRGEVYLRWLQRFSSIGFGTPAGRFLTNYVVLPFVGAFVILKGIDSLVAGLIHLVAPSEAPEETHAAALESPGEAAPSRDEVSETDSESNTDVVQATQAGDPAETTASDASVALAATSGDPDTALPEIPRWPWANPGAETAMSPEGPPALASKIDETPSAEAEEATARAEGSAVRQATGDSDESPFEESVLAGTTLAAPPGHDKNVVHLIPPDALPWVTLVAGILLMGLLHAPRFRSLVAEFLRGIYRGVKGLIYDIPNWFFQRALVRRFLESRTFQFLWRMIVKPSVPALLVWVWMRLIGFSPETARQLAIATFVGVAGFLTLRIGRDLEEISSDWLVRTWRLIRVNIFVGLYQAIVDAFRRFLEVVDRLLYSVDEWLRFRGGESRLSLGLKAVLGVVWFYVTYAIRFIVNLLVEPQINPIKHFPVVTVSHKVMAPYLFVLLYVGLKDRVGEQEAGLIYFFTQLLLPGVFGFLVWELKENYRLYQANQPVRLGAVSIGHHGESMTRLLRPGLHSGTIPKLFTRLRHVERQALLRGESRRLAVRRLREELHHVEEAVQRYLEREFLSLLGQTRVFENRELRVQRIDLSTNRVLAEIGCPGLDPEPALFVFECRSRWLLAGVVRSGWIHRLQDHEYRVLEAALAGLYATANTDLVTQNLEARIPVPASQLEFNEHDMIFWLGNRLDTQISYSLTDRPRLVPRVEGPAPRVILPVLEASQLFFRQLPVTWVGWVATWEAERAGQSPPHPYMAGLQLLPDSNDPSSDTSAPPLKAGA